MVKRGDPDVNIQEVFDFTRDGVVPGTIMLQGRQTVGKVLFDIRGGRLLHRRHRWAAESIGVLRRAPPDSKIANIGVEYAPRTVDEVYDVQALL